MRSPRAHARLTGPLAWLLCFQYFVAEQVARVAWTRPYSSRRNYISDLGAVRCVTTGLDAICSPLHAVMNASFVVQGMLIVTGAVLCRPLLPRGRAVSSACALLVLSGLAVALVGVFPEDDDPTTHYRVAAVHFICGDAGMLLLGVALVPRSSALRGLGWATSSCAVVGLIGLGLLGAHVFGEAVVGAVERVAAYPLPLWFSLTGAVLLRRNPWATCESHRGRSA